MSSAGRHRRADEPPHPGAEPVRRMRSAAVNLFVLALIPLIAGSAWTLCKLRSIPLPESVSRRALAAHVSVEASWDILGMRANVVGAVMSHTEAFVPVCLRGVASRPAGPYADDASVGHQDRCYATAAGAQEDRAFVRCFGWSEPVRVAGAAVAAGVGLRTVGTSGGNRAESRARHTYSYTRPGDWDCAQRGRGGRKPNSRARASASSRAMWLSRLRNVAHSSTVAPVNWLSACSVAGPGRNSAPRTARVPSCNRRSSPSARWRTSV